MSVGIYNFGGDPEETFDFWKKCLKLDVSFDQNSSVVLSSVFGNDFISQKNILINGENRRRWYWFNYRDSNNLLLYVVTNKAEDYPEIPKEKICYAPYFLFNPFPVSERRFSTRENFCCIVVSNQDNSEGCRLRQEFFQRLSSYKKVDSYGKMFNNTGILAPKGKEYLELINKYKFMITFENSYGHGYVTEKIYMAFYGGAIPIYWGDHESAKYFFNENSFLRLENSMDEIIQKIIYLDTHDEEYIKMNSLNPFLNTIEETRKNVIKMVNETINTQNNLK